jgi:hypothetical protein
MEAAESKYLEGSDPRDLAMRAPVGCKARPDETEYVYALIPLTYRRVIGKTRGWTKPREEA